MFIIVRRSEIPHRARQMFFFFGWGGGGGAVFFFFLFFFFFGFIFCLFVFFFPHDFLILFKSLEMGILYRYVHLRFKWTTIKAFLRLLLSVDLGFHCNIQKSKLV